MKRMAGIYTLFAILAVFLLPQAAYADTDVNVSNNGDGSSNSVHVNSQSNGQSVTCVNGNCTTTGGGSKTSVCINGKCTTTDDGNVDMQSPDGHDQVHVHNNTSGNSVTNSPVPSDVSPSPEPSITLEPSITPDPTITQMRNDINSHVQKELDGLKEHMKDQNAAISSFIKDLNDFLNGLFK
jgi:hypothetical protein